MSDKHEITEKALAVLGFEYGFDKQVMYVNIDDIYCIEIRLFDMLVAICGDSCVYLHYVTTIEQLMDLFFIVTGGRTLVVIE